MYSHRSCATEHKTMMTEGFVDGDLVERFLDLSQTQMEEVCKGLKVHIQAMYMCIPVVVSKGWYDLWKNNLYIYPD